MALALARLMREAEQSPGGADKHKSLLEVAREVVQLRRGSHDAERARLERERWETKQAKVAEEKRIAEECWQKTQAEAFARNGFDMKNPAGLLPDELRDCLEASTRLRRAQTGPAGSQNGNLPGTNSREST